MNGRAPAILAATLAILMLIPAASATHWAVYEATAPGATAEPDGATFQRAGHPFNGAENRVVYPGQTAGDGTLFLDARLGTSTGASDTTGTMLYPRDFMPDGASVALLPGPKAVTAWFGSWNDFDGDGAIADAHDACACPDDEFLWRGDASGHVLAINLFFTPSASEGETATNPPGLAGFGTTDKAQRIALVDRTRLENPEQVWGAAASTTGSIVDPGLLATVHTFTLANARQANNNLGYDLSDPAALLDVDRYDAVSPEAETLYASSIAEYRGIVDPSLATARATSLAVVQALQPVFDLVPPLPPGLVPTIMSFIPPTPTPNLVNANSRAEYQAQTLSPFLSADAREPNTYLDDSEGRALFGGVGDRLGSYNTYPGHTSGYGLFFDAVSRNIICAGVYANAAGISNDQALACNPVLGNPGTESYYPSADPFARLNAGGNRTAWGILSFEAYPYLWNDKNGDGHLGDSCKTDSESFNAERNYCENAPIPWPHGQAGPGNGINGETISVCPTSSAGGGTFTVTPIDGAWPPGAVLIKNSHQTTRGPLDDNWVPLFGTDPATLHWRDTCSSITGRTAPLRAEDSILFPSGSQVSLAMDATAWIAGFLDTNLGIDLGYQVSRDVDIIAPTF